ncbi:MAG: hypothetical protein M1832_004870 [Thelocarpon impressellum]|nr:MAG: hypothetical protein M1832_004870 [Thelocarpon impressellum]
MPAATADGSTGQGTKVELQMTSQSTVSSQGSTRDMQKGKPSGNPVTVTDGDVEAQQPPGELPSESSGESSGKSRRSKLNARIISDAIIGLSDGLTVPFALTAGLSAFGQKKVVIYGGLAELIAGAISMGLGGFLGAKSEVESYEVTLAETRALVATRVHQADALIRSVLDPYSIPSPALESTIAHLLQTPEDLVSFLVLFYHKTSRPDASRAYVSGATIGCAYFLGGFVPLVPYFFVGNHSINAALWWSCIVMAVALFSFGYVKTCVICGWRGRPKVLKGIRGALEMLFIGGLAAGAAMGLIRAFNTIH